MNIVVIGENELSILLEEFIGRAGHTVTVFDPVELYAIFMATLAYSGEADKEFFDPDLLRQMADLVPILENADIVLDCDPMEASEGLENFGLVTESLLPEGRPYLINALAASTTWYAVWANEPERVVGWSLVLPASQDEDNLVVEVARGLDSDDDALSGALNFWRSIGIEPLEVGDGPGLVRARVLCCLINEAVSALADGVASPEDIDAAMQLGNNYPAGLLTWADKIGLDIVLSVLEGLQLETGDPAYRPHPYLKRKVWAGHVGKATGRGFFDYD